MEKNLEKSLKRYLKRKVKITTAFLVAFLLGSLSTYGKIIAKYDNVSQTVKFYRNDVDVTQEILKSGSITGDLTNGFIWNNDKTLLEGIEIEGSLTSDGKKFTVKNNGKISGEKGEGNWTGNGIISQFTGKVENSGIITGNNNNGSETLNNGFVVGYNTELSTIDNNGIISGNKGGQYNNSNGIYFDVRSNLNKLNNNGTIKVETNGIYLRDSSTITDLKNIGLIKGISYGISLGNYCGITNFNNYGVIGGKIGAISKDAGYAKNQNNYGLLLSGSGESVALVESGEKTSEQNGKTIINGVTDDKSALSSLGVSDLSGKTDNLIINVAGNKNANGEILNSFNVNNENLTLTNSSINGYENAISLSNGALTLNGTTVNAGENAVTGSAGDETLNIGANSIINGNIDLGTGQDTISVNGSTVNGKVILNGGKFTSQGTTVINGDISTNGADINIRETSKINGNIDILKGDVTFGDNISVNGNINFGDAEGKIIVGENFGTNNFTGKITGNLANGILGANYVIYDDTGVSNLNNQLQIFNGIKTVQLKDDVNNIVNLSNITASHFSEIRGGTGNDSFIVSVDKFEKLSLIDGGADRVRGDSLTIDGSIFTNIKNDGTIDDTVFGKIQNIENLEIGDYTFARLNLNNLNDDYLKNLNIKLGNYGDTITVSTDKLEKLKGLNGRYGFDTLKITNQITNENEEFSFLTKGDGINGINSIETICFSDDSDTINIDNLAKANNEITGIYGGSGDDTFITSIETLQHINSNLIGRIDGDDGKDTIKINDSLDNTTNSDILDEVYDIERLVLNKTGNNILVDNLYSSSNFEEIEGIDGGTNGNTFTIEGTKTEALGVKIEGGNSVNDKLIVNTEISTEQLSNKTGIENLKLGLNKEIDYTIDFTQLKDFKNVTSGNGNDTFTVSTDNIGSMTIDGGGNHKIDNFDGQDTLKLSGVLDNTISGKENILSGVSNIENLRLDNNGNTLNIDNTNGFKNIYGGNGNDTFKVSATNLAKLDRLEGGTTQINNDTLEITSGDIKDNSLGKVIRINNLILAKDSSNVIGLDNLSFNSITKEGTGKDNFTINSNKDKLKMEINGGEGKEDVLHLGVIVDNVNDKDNLKNITGIEKLALNGVKNELSFNDNNKNDFNSLTFGYSSTDNNITLDNVDMTVSFDNNSNNTVNIKANDYILSNKILGATTINLTGDKEWSFASKDLLSGKTSVNAKTFNLGNIVSGKDGFTVNEDFASTGSDITLNGDVKLTISKDTTFALEKLYKFSFSKLSLGADSEITLPEFLKTQNINQKDFTFRVKNWKEYTSVAQNLDFMTYEGRYKEAISKYNKDIAITNAFNSFTEDTIFNYVTNNMGDKLVYYSDEDTKPYAVKVTGEDIVIKTNPDKSKDQSLNLAFNNISSSGDINIEATGGYYNTVTFGNGEGTSVIISSGDKDNLSVINGTSSTEDLTLNFNGATNKVDKIVIDNQNKNSINIKGDTEVKEILLGSGNDSIYAGEDSQKLTIGNINLGSGDDMINIGSTGEIKLSNINLGSGKNEIYFRDISKVKEFNVVKSDEDNGVNEIKITETKSNKDKFNLILAGANKDVEKITVWGENKLQITNDFSGELLFDKSRDNVIGIETDYTGSISFTRGENTVNLSSGTVDGNKLSLAGSSNNLNITDGTLLNGIAFDTSSYGNKVTVGENGKLGKNIKFGIGAGDEFNLTSKTGEFDYNIENADTINLNGKNNQWKFGQSSTIKGDNVIVNLNDDGELGFNIGKSDKGLVLGKDGVNPFATTGNYTINGDIKLTFDDTFTFSSLNDKLSVNTNIFAGDKTKIDIPEFMKYDNKTFSIKSAEELKAFGLGDYAFGNYEHAILNYNKAGYEGITSMLNNNSLTDISKVLNKGIDEKDHYFYSDSREIKDVATLGNINIQTSKDNQVTGDKLNTDINFTNVTGNVANINFAQGTVNKVSFLDGVNISKIDGSQSEAGFDLTLGRVNFTAKEETKVTMSNYDDTLNINSSINDISVNAGAGNDTVNILSSINGIFDGNSGDNTLNIGAKTQTLSNERPKDEIVLSGEVKNFKDINLNQNTKLDSKLAITGTNNINIAKDKVLSLGIDFDKKDSNGKVIGHSLYNKGITVNNNDGNIMVDVAETSKDTLISLGEKDSASKFTNDKNLLISGSTNHDISYDKDSGDVKVNVKEHFIGKEEEVKYGHLDKIYQSIYSADKVGLMAPSSTLKDKTKDEAIKAQLEFYGKIYHSTPYAYTHKISKKSAELITDSLMLNDGMPEVNSWRFGGSIAGRELENSENFYGNNYYNGIDVGNTEVKAETNIYGAYAFGEYGFEEGKAVGFAVAGSKSDTDIDGSSLKGNNAFVSAYVKQDINNVNMIAGIGYQRGFYDATRNVSNAYQSMQVEKDFEDNTFVGYFGAKYRYDFGNNFYLEPNGELRLTHSVQDDIKEDNRGDLSIEVDNKDFTSVDGELGVNLGKRIATENGVLNLKAGVSVNYALLGNDEEYLNARITGSTKDFEIISPEDEDRAKVNVLLKAEYQANNGMYYDLHYKTTTDNDDYSVGFGVGYKF